MVLRPIQQYYQLVVFIFLVIFRFTTQNISPFHAAQSRNDVNLYTYPYVDTSFCRIIPGLTKYQIELCNQQPDTIMVALQGLNQAVQECQSQFEGYRWNCSSLNTRGKNPYISAMFQRGYKETAFAYAISSAGVAIAVARACSSGSLRNCGCDSKIYKIRKSRQIVKENYEYPYSKDHLANGKDEYSKSIGAYSNVRDPFANVRGHYFKETSTLSNVQTFQDPFLNGKSDLLKEGTDDQPVSWKWGGCSHNLKYGVRFSKMFLDSRERADDIHSKINLHNNQVGRRAVQNNMTIKCKCHGISGSCQMKTCWRSTPDLKIVGQILSDKFQSAILVDQTNLGNRNLRKFNIANPKSANKKRQTRLKQQWTPKKNKRKRDLSFDLLYYQKSPNFCDKDPTLDVFGTSGRFCNRTISTGPNSCSSLCCGRGYHLVREKRIERCNCKFIWCCEVKCDVCSIEDWVSVCK